MVQIDGVLIVGVFSNTHLVMPHLGFDLNELLKNSNVNYEKQTSYQRAYDEKMDVAINTVRPSVNHFEKLSPV